MKGIKHFLQGPETFKPVCIVKLTQLSHDTKLFTFSIGESLLGLPIGQHILLKAHLHGEDVLRQYTPTSPIDRRGTFDIPIKVYYSGTDPLFPVGGSVTQYLDGLQPGNTVHIAGPRGRLVYLGNSEFRFKKGETEHHRRVKRLGLISGGSGVTPCFQFIQYIAENNEDVIVNFLYANKTERDILLKRRLDEYAELGKIKVSYVVEDSTEGWKGAVGRITQEIVQQNMPGPGTDCLVCHCGSKGMNFAVRDILLRLGYSEEQIFKF